MDENPKEAFSDPLMKFLVFLGQCFLFLSDYSTRKEGRKERKKTALGIGTR